ncbi:unnamed protein product [Rangifer tarandus platyrhynchus]|uniref:Secreted protein n=1 Tax=Rangifer tarandus platyrhynchus TaxID=3082113 RepID=A0ABN8XKX7_RANTA|nr:unnamed protein product [Rangifer tarandus platyrhynchus]
MRFLLHLPPLHGLTNGQRAVACTSPAQVASYVFTPRHCTCAISASHFARKDLSRDRPFKRTCNGLYASGPCRIIGRKECRMICQKAWCNRYRRIWQLQGRDYRLRLR